jgi:hypothetical protein
MSTIMSIKHRAALRIASLVLPALLVSATAQANDLGQTGDAGRAASQGARTDQPGIPPAPIGHRQPRAADMPSTTGSGTDDPFDQRIKQLNGRVDRNLRICRGC